MDYQIDADPSAHPALPPEPARNVIERLDLQIRWLEHIKKPEESISIQTATPFGVHRALRISAEGADLLCIETMVEEQMSILIAPVNQCAFMFQVYIPTKDKPEQKTILGFARSQKQANE